MKKHTTVTITKRMLQLVFSACGSGLEEVKHLLPAKVSTDPERNFALAFKLCKNHGAEDEHADRAFWLVSRAMGSRVDVFPTDDLLVGAMYDTQYDAFIIAQWLAWVADALATKAGR